MGWRFGFGVGPFHYSTPLWRRRRSGSQSTGPQRGRYYGYVEPLPGRTEFTKSRRQGVYALIVALVFVGLCVGSCVASMLS